MKSQKQEYQDAFNAGDKKPEDEATPVMDEAGPVAEEAPMADAAPAEAMPAEDVMAEPAATEETPAEPATESTPMTGEDSGDDAMTDDSDLSDKELQRKRSWEGSLKKREAALAAEKAAMAETAPATPGEAMAKLSEQFGPEFADLIVQVIRETAAPAESGDTESLRSDINDVIAVLKDQSANRFKETVMAAHEDAYEIGETPEFKEWCATQDDAAECERIVEDGTSKEVIALLTRFKDSLSPGKDGDDDSEAAEAVRNSSPITLPNRPVQGADDEYRAAWNQM